MLFCITEAVFPSIVKTGSRRKLLTFRLNLTGNKTDYIIPSVIVSESDRQYTQFLVLKMSFLVILSRLMLVCSLWQPPLPLPDYHRAGPTTGMEFQHFARFHTSDEHLNPNLGWHLHFVWAHRTEIPADAGQPNSGIPRDGDVSNVGPVLCTQLLKSTSPGHEEQFATSNALVGQSLMCDLPIVVNLLPRSHIPRDRGPSSGRSICVFRCTWQC